MPPLMGVEARQLDGGLVGLGPGVAEEHPVHAGQRGQLRAQRAPARRSGRDWRCGSAPGLLAQGVAHRRVGVAEAAHGDAGQGVEITLAVASSHSQAPSPRMKVTGRRL